MMPTFRREALRLVLSALVLHLLLVQPNHPGAMTWGALALFPLELPVILLALLAVGRGRFGIALRVLLVAALILVALLKAADFGMFTALSRGFNPVADMPLIVAGLRLLSGTIGLVPAILAVCACLVVIGLIVRITWWATGVWAAMSPSAVRLRAGAAIGAVAAFGVATAEIGASMGAWTLPIGPPGAAFSARVGLERLQTTRDTLADLALFRTAAAVDPYAETEGLLDLIDRDVLIIFIESYGRTSIDTALFSDLHLATLSAGQERLESLGLSMASGYLASPTQGGQSWLAHSTFSNGLWIDGQTRYGAALASGRQTLFHIAARLGFHTAAVMPQITLNWPEAQFMGFETVFASSDLGYQGLPFNWVTMPDQFTFAALDALLRDAPRADNRPLFVQIATGTSHAPWLPVPELVAWSDVGDGSIFNDMALAGDPPDVVWRDRDRVRAQYRLAIDYALQTVLAYAELHADNPPLMIVMGDHQAAGFVALDERRDVPLHVIGPAHLVDRVGGWGLSPGLIPAQDAPVRPMDQMRNLILETFSSTNALGG